VNAETIVTRPSGRRPLAALGKLTLAAMLGVGVVFVLGSLILNGTIDPFSLVGALIAFACAGLVVTGWRWAPAAAGVVAALLVLMLAAFGLPTLSRPHEPDFTGIVLVLALALVAAAAGFGAAVQNYRGGERRMPRGMAYALTALGGLVLGAILVGLIPQQGAAAGVSAEVMAGLPTMKAEGFAFGPRTIQVKAGETVALRLVNEDTTAHTFDVDELDVHAPMPGGESALALFEATTPGTYTFYCAIPGHADAAARTGMVGTLIVEPAG
jgi:uncharacterized cupredoxin-like copper-binding protein